MPASRRTLVRTFARRGRRRLALVAASIFVLAAAPGYAHDLGARSSAVFEGKILLRHGDVFSAGRAQKLAPALQLDDGTLLRLDFGSNRAPDFAPGSRVRVRGVRQGGSVAVAAGGAESISGSTAVAATAGAKRVAVVLFNFSNNTSQPYTPASAAGVAFTNSNSVAAYYAETSWNQLTLSGDAYGWYTIPDTDAGCNYTAWGNSANLAAAGAGVNLGAYDYVVYGFPSAASCGWSGLAYLPGRYSWLNGTGGMSLRVMAHELGHNFGTHHASSLSCTDSGVRVSLSATCTASEYGDPFTVMGGATRYQHSNFARGNFGWLQAANTRTVTASGDYLLAPIEGFNAGAVQVLRIQRTTGVYLTLEFRQPFGSYFDTFSSSDPVVNGVTVRIAPDYATRTQSQLVDATPATSSFSDAPLPVGSTLVDPLTGILITNAGVSPLGATVRVSLAPDTTAPTTPGGLIATPLDGTRVSLSWAASSDNVGVSGYRVYRNSALVGTVTTPGFTDSGLSPGTAYSYDVVAFDAAGNASTPATASATTPTAGDTQAPTAPGNLKSATAKRKVTLSWSASSDNVGVTGYRVYRNGVRVATLSGTASSFVDNGVAKGAQQYGVEAFDAAGNTGPRATVTAPV